MKNYLFAVAVVVMPSSAYAAEDANVLDGFISASVGYKDNGINEGGVAPVEVMRPKSDDATLAIRGSLALPLANNIGMQADLGYSQEPMNAAGVYSGNQKSTTVATHLFYRGSEKFLVGAIGQINFNQTGVYTFQIDTKQYFIGGEAQASLKNLTLTAQVAYRKDDFGFISSSVDGVAAVAQAKYFIDPNWSLAVKGDYSSLSLNVADQNLKQWRVGMNTEHRLTSMPVSLFANVGYGESKLYGDKLHDTRMMVGIKFNFGSKTLQQRDHSGASLNPFESDFMPLLGLN